MAIDKGYIQLRSRLILRCVLFGLLTIAGVSAMYAGAFAVPFRVFDETSIHDVRRALITVIVCDSIAGLCLLAAVYLILITLLMLIRSKTSSVKVYKLIKDSSNPWLKPDKRPGRLMLRCVFIYLLVLAGAVFISLFPYFRAHSFMSTGSGDVGAVHIRNTLYKVLKDEKNDRVCTVYYDMPQFESGSVSLLDKLGSPESFYWLETDSGRKIPVTTLDKSVLTKFCERHKNTQESLLKIEYYERSGLVKAYEFVPDRRDMESFDMPLLELTVDDSFTVTRPDDTAAYGETAWLVTNNDELLHTEDAREDCPYSISADTLKKLSLTDIYELFGDKVRGNITVQLVKIFTYPDPSGYYDPEEEVLPISNTVTYTIAGGSEIINAIGGDKLEIEADEKNFCVTLPQLPERYAAVADVFLALELSGTQAGLKYGEDPHTERYPYEEGKTYELPVISAHYKVYVYALDDEGGEVVISSTAEFDYMSQEDKKKEEERLATIEYFEPFMQALENHDAKAIKAMLSEYTVSSNNDIDAKIDKLLDVYKGGRIDRDAILYPYVQRFEDSEGKYSEDNGDLWITTDTGGEYHIYLQTCYVNKRYKDQVGVLFLSVTDSGTAECVSVS